jgi:Putative zincin peptidase
MQGPKPKSKMRFCIGIVPPNESFQPQLNGWTKFREPTMLVFWLCALPVAAVMLVGLLVAIGSVGDTSAKIVIKTGDVTIGRVAFVFLLTILGFCAVLLAHELLHLLAHPKAGLSRDSVVGVWPRAFVFYAFYDNEISRNRFLVSIALPFMVLSLGPMVLFWITGKVFLWLVFVALVNGIGSCFDLLVIAMVLAQVPSNALIRNKGWLTYWKQRAGI